MDTQILYYLAKNNASFKPFETTTSEIAKGVKSTQQTVSRRLIMMEEEGWIIREATTRGLAITLSRKALSRLKEDYILLKSVFEPINEFEGKIKKGLGEGKYYMQQQQYQVQFREKLGFFPWPGTLNLKVDIEQVRKFLVTERPVFIEGFKGKERTFGGLWCYPVKIRGERAAVAIPLRTTHPEDIVEIIAPFEVKEKFQLKDDDGVKVTK